MKDQCDYPKCFANMQINIHRGDKSVQLCDLHAGMLLSENPKMAKKTEKLLKLLPIEPIYRVNAPAPASTPASAPKARETPDDIHSILSRLNSGELNMCPEDQEP